MGRRRVASLVGLLVVLLTVAGCTGVPGSSSPQVVRTVGLGEPQAPSAPAPPKGASPRAIVQGFLEAMGTNPDRLDSARAFLDADAAQRWSGASATIVQQSTLVVGDVEPDNTVKVSYQAIGALSADGVYTPTTPQGLGVGTAVPVTYTLARNGAGEWRIQALPTGLIIGDEDFARRFTPKALYFLDTSGRRLVPDLRYSALAEPALETFLLTQLAAGPRPDLEGVVNPFEPAPNGNQRLTVTPGAPTVVQIPGASALSGEAVTQLAGQVAYTLRPTSFQSELQLQDGTRVVDVPGVGPTFDVDDFASLAPVDDSVLTTATFLRGGAVVSADGTPLPGALSTSSLDSAVFDRDGGRTLVAGTTGPDGDGASRRLLVGDASGLKDVGVPEGALTAPAWAPVGTTSDVDEVWVAAGGQLYRYDPGSTTPRVAEVPVAGLETLPGTILSLSFSPEGSRLALVYRAPDGAGAQVWVAPVLRNGPDVQLGPLQQTTPTAYDLVDVGWRSDTLLAAVGTSSTLPAGVYVEVFVDGSRLRASATDGLTDRPRSLAVSPVSSQQWVTVGSGGDVSVWTRETSLAAWTRPAAPSPVGYGPSFSR